MFNDSDSFFYSPTGDLTNTLQRQFSGKYNAADPVWKRVSNVHPCTCTPVHAKFIDGLVVTTKHGVLSMYISENSGAATVPEVLRLNVDGMTCSLYLIHTRCS